MITYYIVWVSVIFFAAFVVRKDYPVKDDLSYGQIEHSSAAKVYFIIASLILILVAGLRYNVGTDYGAYSRGYRMFLDFWGSLKNLSEPSIHLIYSIAVKIHDNGQFCTFVVTAIIIGLELRVIYKNTDNIGFALVIFLFTCWSACFNGVRQCLATAVLFCGYPALRDRKFLKYALFVFLAFLCHRSALVMILLYFIVNRDLNAGNILFLVVSSVIVLISYEYVFRVAGIILDESVSTTATYWGDSINRIRILTQVAPAVFFLLVYRKREKTPQVTFYINLLLAAAVVSVVTMNSRGLGRMSMYMTPFVVISIAELIKIYRDKNLHIASIIIAALYGTMEWIEVSGSSSLNNFQFQWIW